ncbi:radical SAM protein [Methanofollis formosanus]|uniref:Radical SAM protein n=1 Tax=Methanofollis formosanus TaxID=299308 RepID=A0A8G1EGY0_9EURY|nr:radical SAM protein [Methanofollis formosanus]QYZ79649.1 radical SAM protein [Methanofollis formosanus]
MKCHYCERRCDLSDERIGFCRMYSLNEGTITERFPHRWSSYQVTHIESLPFFHAYPGARTLQVGTAGCNLTCSYCSNAFVARTDPATVELFHVSPERLVQIAEETGCHTIVFGVNEPTVSVPSLLDLAAQAHTRGIPIGCLTNGYMTEESAHTIAEHLSFVNVSLKSLSSAFYQKHAGVESVDPVLRTIGILAEHCHVEVTTPIVQGENDHEIKEIARFIAGIDPSIPWHVFRLLPEHRMAGERAPDIRHIDALLEPAREMLPYVYFSNFVGSNRLNTVCPACGRTVVERINPGGCGGKIVRSLLEDGRCPFCGETIPIHGERVMWDSMEVDDR